MDYTQKIEGLKKITSEKLPRRKSVLRKSLEAIGLHIKEVEANFDIHPRPEVWVKAEFVGKPVK